MKVEFINSETYITDPMWQWDLNQTLEITGMEAESAPLFHFSNRKSTESISVRSSMVNGVISVNVPNGLLAEPYNIIAVAGITNKKISTTIYRIEIPVRTRTMPEEYYFTNNIPIHTFEALEGEIEDHYSMSLEALADAEKKIGDKLLKEKSERVQSDSDLRNFIIGVDSRIGQIVASSGTSSTEVVASRVNERTNTTYMTLGQRLDRENEFLRKKVDDIIDDSVYWNGTPFKYIRYDDENEMQSSYNADGSRNNLFGCTKIHKAPKILGINLKSSTARIFVYIGDMVNGDFVLDRNYVYNTTSSGILNYISNSISMFIEGEKYFYYKMDVDPSNIELIGCDYVPESELDGIQYTPYSADSDNVPKITSLNMGIIIPNDCDYLICDKNKNLTAYSTAKKSNTSEFDGDRKFVSYGSVGNVGASLITISRNSTYDDVYLYIKKKRYDSPSGKGFKAREIAKQLTSLKWISKKRIRWSDTNNYFEVGKEYRGIPYSSRWKNSHSVGYEITPFTLMSAIEDEYSVFYDEAEQNPTRKGSGYGLVCSTFLNLCQGNPYPQSGRGISYDDNFIVSGIDNVRSGMYLISDKWDHVIMAGEEYDNGQLSVFEGIQPCCIKSHRTVDDRFYKALSNRTTKNILNYSLKFTNLDSSGYKTNYMDFDNISVTNGSVRPFRGNKCVYGSWDKSEDGSGIKITIHDGATTAIMVKPDGTIRAYAVDGRNVIDVSADIDQGGIYELYSDVSGVKEYFKYLDHDDVTFNIDKDGLVTFSHDDVDYAYVSAEGYGFPVKGGSEKGSMVIAKGSHYPKLVGKITNTFSALVRDPDEDSWGRASIVLKGIDGDDSDDTDD